MESKNPQHKHFTINEANGLFFSLALVFLTLGAYVQSQWLLPGLLITEYGIIFIPIVGYALVKGKDLKAVFKFKKIKIKTFFQIFVIAMLLIPTIAVANLLVVWFIELFGDSFVSDIPTASTGFDYLILMFIISITAGICEETFFRGMILDAYQTRFGYRWGAIFSGLLFGIFHFNPQNLLGPIILGIVFAYLVQITGSIVAGVVAHAANNGIAVTLGFLVNLVSPDMGAANEVESLYSNTGLLLAVILFYALIALVCFIGVLAIIRSIKKDYSQVTIGSTFSYNSETYEITRMDEDKLFVRSDNEDKERITTLENLKKMNIGIKQVLWQKKPLALNFVEILPLALTVLAYGYIIYLAYFL